MKTPRRQPFRAYLVTIASAAVLVPQARADAPWAPSPLSPAPTGTTPLAVSALVRYDHGLVPVFRSGERDRVSVGGGVAAWLGANVCVRADWAWLRDDTAAGDPVAGAGDATSDAPGQERNSF